jgi:hypothetical protein
MRLVDTNERLAKRIQSLSRDSIFVYPILSSLNKHSAQTRISSIMVSDGVIDLFINYHNIDSECVSNDIDFSEFKRVFVYKLKDFLYHYKGDTSNIYDFEAGLFHSAKDYEVDEGVIYTIFRRRQAPRANDLIPIWKHYEEFLKWKNLWSQNATSRFAQLYPKSLFYIEKNGINTVDGIEYTNYNFLTTTSRPSNAFGGINYAALKKDGDTRKRFVSRFENGKLYQLDFDGYHIRLIGKLIDVDIPLDIKAHKWLANQYGVDDSTAKAITFRQLYGGVQEEYIHIPFFKKVSEYIEYLWGKFKTIGYVETPILNRKIVWSDDLNKNKLFNYILQSVETERNIIIIDKLSKLHESRSLPVLYTYDSILFDVHPDNGIEYIKSIKSIMEIGGYPTEVEVGDNYKDMVKVSI